MPAAGDSLSEDSLARGAHSACTRVPPQPPPLRPLAERGGQSRVQKGLEYGAICGQKVCCGWRRQEKLSSTVPWAGGVLNMFVVGTVCQCGVQAGVSTWLDAITIKAATFIFRRRGPRAWR